MVNNKHKKLVIKSNNSKFFLYIAMALTSALASLQSKAENIVKIEVTQSIFGAGEIITDCKIGEKTQKCKVDTGAPYSMSSDSELNSESNLINEIQYYGITGSVENCNFVETKNPMSINSEDFKGRALLICPSETNKGLLGLNHLMENPVLLNLKNKTMIMNPSATPDNLHTYISDSNDHIFIKIKIYKSKVEHEILAMLDTGASITVANKELIKSHPEFITLLSSSNHGISDTNSAEIETQLGFINGLQISNKKVIIPYVMFTDFKVLKQQTGLDVDMIIGVNVLTDLNDIYFNAAQKTWAIN